MNASLALPNVARATLPATYERAKESLACCVRLDECKDWADKAAALASYAKQAADSELHNHAVRIQARAIRRAGELLQEFQSPGGRPSKTTANNAGVSQRKAAADAGMNEYQEKTAVRVATVPAEEFEEAIETDRPATVTALADRGTAKRPVPPGVAEATELIGMLRHLERKETVYPLWVAHEVCTSHNAGLVGSDSDTADDVAFFTFCGYTYTRQLVTRCVNLREQPDKHAAQPLLPGFEYLQRGYVITRDGEDVLVPTDQLTDDELIARANLFKAQSSRLIAHANELRRYVEWRRAQADALVV